jgi:hypothetical protein
MVIPLVPQRQVALPPENSWTFQADGSDSFAKHHKTSRVSPTNQLQSQRVEISVLREFSAASARVPSSATSPSRRVSSSNIPPFFAVMPASPSVSAHVGSPLPQIPTKGAIVSSEVKPQKGFVPSGIPAGKPISPAISRAVSFKTSQAVTDATDDVGVKVANWNISIFVLVQIYALSIFLQHGLQDCSGQSRAERSEIFALLPTGVAGMSKCDFPDFFIMFFSFFVLLLPYLLFVALQDISIVWVWSMLVSSALTVFGMTFYLSAHHCWLSTMVFLTFVITLIVDAQIHKVQMFLTTRKLGDILEENERMALHNHAQEMRHMIANVAHDLKTVSLQFSSYPYFDRTFLISIFTFIFHSLSLLFSPAWNTFKSSSMNIADLMLLHI